jgi:6-phosphogluconolactonase/glucosamine-6-phosphate isomerase/deaminase
VAFLVAGEDKRDVLRELLSPQAAVELPAQRVRPSGELFCFSDLRL